MLGIVPDVDDLLCPDTGFLQGRMKHVRVRFAGAYILRQKGKIKVFSRIGFVDIGVAIGQGTQGIVAGQ